MTRTFLTRFVVVCSVFMSLASFIESAYADSNGPSQTNCPNASFTRPPGNYGRFEIGACATEATGRSYQPYEFTSKLVDCIQGTIQNATTNMMTVFSNEFGWLTGALATMVIMFYGVRVATGERDILKRGSILSLKLAFVVIFVNNLPMVSSTVFGTLIYMLGLVAGGPPWGQIDTFLGTLVGFGPSIVLLNGLLGLVGAAAFSSTIGLLMFFFGIIALLKLLSFILALIYTYLLAFLTIGFLVMLSPVMIPLALFFYTERMFRKWADIIVSAILTPVLLFGFVWMFIGVFDVLIQNIFMILGGNDFKPYWRLNTSLFSWLMPSDPNSNLMMQYLPTNNDLDCVDRTIRPPVQTNINPLGANAFNVSPVRLATLDFGANDVNIVQALSFAFATLWLFASLMKSMVHMIPEIASSIASVSSNIAFGGRSALVQKVEGGINKMQSGLMRGVQGDGKKFNMGESLSQHANSVSNFTKQMANLMGVRDK